MRIGVVSDTHCPEYAGELPGPVLERLRGVALILHCGDVGGPGGEATLAALRLIAPVHAVRGDHDAGLGGLPERLEMDVGGHRIAVVHGNRTRLLEEPITLIWTLTLGRLWPRAGLTRWLRRQFPRADVILYGHTHQARVETASGALLFNPGAVYLVTPQEARRRLGLKPGWFEWSWLQVVRHRRDRQVASVGVLELDGERTRARVLPLAEAG